MITFSISPRGPRRWRIEAFTDTGLLGDIKTEGTSIAACIRLAQQLLHRDRVSVDNQVRLHPLDVPIGHGDDNSDPPDETSIGELTSGGSA
ncbi:hypothetical protein [Shimia sp.]|uniref:hypothetical protein n=1 Tax=Shimia sp. TaxID=1954381 RepID=UPI0032988DF0